MVPCAARPLSGHAHPVRRQQAPPGPSVDRSRQRHSTGSATGQAVPRGGATPSSQFGYKAQVCDNDDGVIVDHTVEQGNPADAPQLAPAIARVTHRAGRPPGAVTADRGYGEARVDTDAMKERASAPRDSHPRATLGLFTSTTTREALWTSMTAGSLSG